MRPVEFEPTISAGERPKTYALDRAATGTGSTLQYCQKICTQGTLTGVRQTEYGKLPVCRFNWP
jgi:hypothetical protein